MWVIFNIYLLQIVQYSALENKRERAMGKALLGGMKNNG